MSIRRLAQADYPAFEAFLSRKPETSMFMRSNARQAGLDYAGEPFQALYWGAFDGPALQGVLALNWNGNLMSETADEGVLRALYDAAGADRPAEPVLGVIGPRAQAQRLLGWLGVSGRDLRLELAEVVFHLRLDGLKPPAALADGLLVCRRAAAGDAGLLRRWRSAYETELHLAEPGPELAARTNAAVAALIDQRRAFVAEAGGTPVAMAGYNAELPDVVQIGGVYTPPEQRCRGFARAAVAASLIAARDEGVTSAFLFTHTPAAERAYRALGFQPAGEYHMAMLRRPAALRP